MKSTSFKRALGTLLLLAVWLSGNPEGMFAQVNKSEPVDQARTEIIQVMQNQMKAWNAGDVDGFMEGYWNSDSLRFISKNGITSGWKPVLERYKKSYPNKSAMGELRFDELDVRLLDANNAYVTGRWSLQFENKSPAGGYFTLLFQRFHGGWKIVCDHTS